MAKLLSKLHLRSHKNLASRGFALAALLLWATAGSALSAENVTPAYLIKQNSVIQGPGEILISPLGVRMTLSDRHLVIFMRPPLWHVQYFDPRSKRYYECPQEKFREPLASTVSMTKPSSSTGLAVASSKPKAFMTLPCREFTLNNPVKTQEKRTQSWQQIMVQSGVADGYDEGTGKIVGKTLCRIYALPQFDAVPLLVIVKNYRDEFNNELETKSVKKVTAIASDFAVPANSVLVPKVTNVAKENDVDASLTELFK